MKILVCINHTPDTAAKINFKDNDTKFNSSEIRYTINPYDETALWKAVELCTDNTITSSVIHVGESAADASLKKALSFGIHDAFRIDTPAFDSNFTAHQLASFIKDKNYDLILCGSQSIDYNGMQVPGMLAELLNIASVSTAKKLNISNNKAIVNCDIGGIFCEIEMPMPCIVGCSEGAAKPKTPNIRNIMSASSKPLNVLKAVDCDTYVKIKNYESLTPRGEVKLIDPESPELLITELRNKKII